MNASVTLAARVDVASTRSFVDAYATMLASRTVSLPRSSASADSWVRAVARGCRGVLDRAPMRGAQARAILREVDGSVAVAFNAPARPAMARFVRRTARLLWSRRAVARQIGSFAGAVDALARMRVPHLCADLEAWAHGGYRALPPGTAAFDARLQTIMRQQSRALTRGVLRPYLGGSGAAAAARADALARRYARLAGARAQRPINRLALLLGVH